MAWLIVLASFAVTTVLFASVRESGEVFERAGALGDRIARHPLLAAVVVFIAALLFCLLPLRLFGPPLPLVHDESAYLLAGETFARGRLTNPTHLRWPFFDTFHVIHQPTYASKFPIGQGLAIAVGLVMGGKPYVGVYLSTALACLAVWWALRACLAPRWALLGGLIAAAHPLVSLWSQSYWGGSVAMLGGALLLGAVLRVGTKGDRALSTAFAAATGLAILANSRPFEGVLMALLCGVWLTGCWLVERARGVSRANRSGLRPEADKSVGLIHAASKVDKNVCPTNAALEADKSLGLITHAVREVDGNVLCTDAKVEFGLSLRFAATVCGLMLPVLGFMAYYNWRVTGDARTMPYVAHARQYMVAPIFRWQPLKTAPHFTNPQMADFYIRHEVEEFQRQTSWTFLPAALWERVTTLWAHYVNPVTVVVPAAACAFIAFHRARKPAGAQECARRRSAWLALLVCLGLPVIHALLTPWFRVPYMAPAMAGLVLMVVTGLGVLTASGHAGRAFAAGVIVSMVVAVFAFAPLVRDKSHARVAVERQRIVDMLERDRGANGRARHLVLVRYGPNHGGDGFEFVFNGPDIDGQDVVFARSSGGDDADAPLIRHFADRTVWTLDFDEFEFVLRRLDLQPKNQPPGAEPPPTGAESDGGGVGGGSAPGMFHS